MTEMRPDPDSDLAGEQSEYGDDTGFAAEATRTANPDVNTADAAPTPDGDPGATTVDSAGLTAEDDELGNGAD